MSTSLPGLAVRSSAHASGLPRLVDLTSLPPALVSRPTTQDAGPGRRTKIWEFNANLHCSIIGTCLSTQELRHLLKKLKLPTDGVTDHDLHGLAVGLAARHDEVARQLNKALDQRHKLTVSQFAKAATEQALRAMWAEAVKRGDIPSAYWATLTHPAANRSVIRDAFGEVHMLSHLVGSANRADLKRLCQLQAEKAALEEKLARQQAAFHDAVVGRDAQIADLRRSLVQQVAVEPASHPTDPADETAPLRALIIDLQKRLAAESNRRSVAEERLDAAQAALTQERLARGQADQAAAAMQQELAAAEASLQPAEPSSSPRLDGSVLLYVGGRPNQTAHLRTVTETLGATFLHHDGGIECHPTLLPGLVSRSDVVLFPVDCISHEAALTVKALCRQGGKRFIPLRTASVTALLAGLRAVEMPSPQAAAE